METKTLRLLRLVLMELPRKARNKVVFIGLSNLLLGLLDVISVLIIGVIGALFVSGFTAQPSNLFGSLVELLNLDNLSLQRKVATLGAFAASFLILKSMLSLYLTHRLMKFLTFQASQISRNLLLGMVRSNLNTRQGKSVQETIYAINNGVLTLVLEFLGSTLLFIADIFLTSLMLITLFTLDSTVALWTLSYFGLITYFLLAITRKKIARNAKNRYHYEIASNELVDSFIGVFREAKLRGGGNGFVDEFMRKRSKFGESLALGNLYSISSKYVIEIALVLGAIALAFQQFASKTAVDATATLAVFLVASFRIAPAVLRISNGIVTMRATSGLVEPTLNLIEEYQGKPVDSSNSILRHQSGISKAIEVRNLSYRYGGQEEFALQDINFQLEEGTFAALVGPSGSGKSSLADLVCGLRTPTFGTVDIYGQPANKFIESHPGLVGYVPQRVNLIDGTLRDNLLLGFSATVSDEELLIALSVAHLSELASNSSDLDVRLGEKGNVLSGGQRQRIGIARAFITQPLILVLDEATSALDGSAELDLASSISTAFRNCTIVVIAHRLTTVKTADLILYLDNGKVAAHGTLEQVRNNISNFDKQLKIQGIY